MVVDGFNGKRVVGLKLLKLAGLDGFLAAG
jgi:hypothetical protein